MQKRTLFERWLSTFTPEAISAKKALSMKSVIITESTLFLEFFFR